MRSNSMAKDSIISNSSYTNKDFQSIYPALLDLVKKITYRWDPSISNESDPGVILLKLNALIADKCNYNIDKNVLECFPLSVTQDRNARQLFEQLGYYMHWYLAATGQISIRWSIDPPTNVTNYQIPKFTMVTDDEQSIVYTIMDDLPLVVDGSYNTFNVIQGTISDYSLNGDTLITAQNLDNNNRLYFQETNVAQNGIFIRNSSQLNYDDWKIKDNLTVETVSASAKNYKFGVTLDTNVCYIEFPTNAEELIGDGIYIKYIKTDGYSGNIAPFRLTKLYDNIVINVDGVQVLLNEDNIEIKNYSAITNGEDTESINSAYQGYKRIVGTFDTLVTLRDYINAIRRFPNVSNGFVTDRTTDPNFSANIMQNVNDVTQRNSVPLWYDEDGTVQMFPYTLNLMTLYAKDDYSDITTISDFNNTFKVLDEVDLERGTSFVQGVEGYLSDEKHIQQEFITPSYINTSSNSPEYLFKDGYFCFLKNKYKINVKITPQYRLTQIQIDELQNNVRLQILNNLNSKQIEFGDEADYDFIYDLIMSSDERIKAINLDDITYQTYAVYFVVDGTVPKFIDVPIGGISTWFNSISDLKTGYHLTYDPYSSQPDPQVDAVKFASATNYAHGQFTIKAVVDTDVTTSAPDFSATLTSSFDPSDIFMLTDGSASTVSILYDASSATHWMFNGGINDGRAINTLTPYGINVVGTPNNGDTITLTPNVSYSITATQESTQIDTVSGEFNPRNNINLSEYGLSASDVGWNISFFALGIIDSPVFTSNVSVNYPNLPSYLESKIIAKNILAGKTPYYVFNDDYPDFYINQEDVQISPVSSVELVGKLDSSVSGGVLTANVDTNTLCRFYAPNLITTDTYSSYVKYEYYFNNDVETDSSYKLGTGEYVAFYWSAGMDSGYFYTVYGTGNIINPSFFIAQGYPKSGGNNLVLPTVLADELASVTDIPQKISGVTYELASTIDNTNSVASHIQTLSNAGYILSTAKFISIQLMNQLTLDSSYYCSWVLNTPTSDNTYVLFDEPTASEISDGVQSRILRQNEYFIYTNATKSSLIILGQGTQLSRIVGVSDDAWNDVWECSSYDYSEILSSGLDTLVDKQGALQQVPQGKVLTATEMQYIAVPPGGSIQLVGTSSYPIADDATIDINSLTVLDSAHYSRVSYRGRDSETYAQLPLSYSHSDTDLGWKLECVGVIDILPSSYMELTDNQHIKIDGTTTISDKKCVASKNDIYGEGVVETDASLFLFNKLESTKWSGTDIDKITYSSNGDEALIRFQYNAEGYPNATVSLPIEGAGAFCVFNINSSLIPIGIPNLMITYNFIRHDDSLSSYWLLPVGTVRTIQFDSSEFKAIRIHVQGLPSDNTPILIEVSGLKPVKNYWEDSDMQTNIQNAINSILDRQISSNKEFDYSYEVDADELVENPIDSKSFFDFNHEYNKFTIAQLDTSSLYSGVYVTNKVR